jgi:hypothetical protein
VAAQHRLGDRFDLLAKVLEGRCDHSQILKETCLYPCDVMTTTLGTTCDHNK